VRLHAGQLTGRFQTVLVKDSITIYELLQRHPGGILVGTDLGTADFPVLAADREETLARFSAFAPRFPCPPRLIGCALGLGVEH
jgi:hypothetical protein